MQGKKKEHTEKVRVGLVVLLTALALVLGFAAYSRPAMAAQKELEIGGIFGLSGPGSEALARKYDGVKAAVAWINDDKGGINIKGDKYRIKLIAESSNQTPEAMKEALEKDDMLDHIRNEVLHNKVFDFIEKNAKITMARKDRISAGEEKP